MSSFKNPNTHKNDNKNDNMMTQRIEKTHDKGWLKFVRITIYTISTICVTVGAGLMKAGELSSSYADGSSTIKTCFGKNLFYISFLILCMNIMWGVLRWFLRGSRESWRASRIIGKLIGGGIWRFVVFTALILISAIFITPKVEAILTLHTEQEVTPVSFSEKYDRLQYINDNLGTLNYSEIKDELSALLFNNIDFDVDASSNVSNSKGSIFFENAYAYSSTVTTLNKASLSDDGHFVVFYTDTGDDKISDTKAAELASMLEEIISGYLNNLGFEYKYERLVNNYFSISKMQKVLENSGIDAGILDSAMPVYVVDPYKDGSSTLASYAGKRFKDLGASILVGLGSLFGEETAKLYSTTPSYPFINILPKNINSESLPIVTAHELGHHYAAIYNENTYGKTGSDDNFVDETAPNWMAINVLPNQPQGNLINDNHYNKVYLSRSTDDTISKVSTSYDFDGYPAVAFLQNYYEIVPNAKTIIMDAVYYGDALNYLYEHAGSSNFRDVMMSLAEKNLTGDYSGKLINMVTPKGTTLSCADICTRTFYMNPASTKYVYFSTNEYRDVTINFAGEKDKIEASLLGKTVGGDWKIIEQRIPEMEFKVNKEIAKEFEVLALATANYTLADEGKYTVKIAKTAIEDIFTEDGKFDFSKYNFSNFYSDVGAGCYEIDTNALFDNLTSLVDLGTDFVGALTRLGEELEPGTDFSSTRTEYEANAEEAKSALSEAKNELSPYKITVCGNYIEKESNFDIIKSRLKEALIGTINIIDERDGDDRFSTFVGFDLFARTGRIYILAQLDGEMGLITINIEEK